MESAEAGRSRHAEASELVPAITFADAEIEPPARQQIEGRGLFRQQHRIVPGQDQYRRAEPQMPGAGAEPGQQIEAGRNLAKAGEMMLDEKCAVVAQRLGFDIIVDEVAKALAAVGIGAGSPGLRAAEQSEFHLLTSSSIPADTGDAKRVLSIKQIPNSDRIHAALA